MSSGHASHKGGGVKQSHDNGRLDSAATSPVSNPEDLLGEGEGYPFNAQDADVNPAAVASPQEGTAQPQQRERSTQEQQR